VNERHPYDKKLAEKLESLPLPDMQQSWEGMKRLLDEEDRKGAAIPPKNGKKGSPGWLLLLCLILLVGLGLYFTSVFVHKKSDTEGRSSAITAKAKDLGPSKEKKESASVSSSENSPVDRKYGKGNGNASRGGIILEDRHGSSKLSNATGERSLHVTGRDPSKFPKVDMSASTNGQKPQKGGRNGGYIATATGVGLVAVSGQGNRNNIFQEGSLDTKTATSDQEVFAKPYWKKRPLASLRYYRMSPVSDLLDSGYWYPSIDWRPSETSLTQETRLDSAKYKTKRRRVFAIGAFVSQQIPIAGQKFTFNDGAAWVDYIPFPFVRFYLSDEVCLQSELGLFLPQYTAPILVENQKMLYNTANPYTITYTTYVRRLTYYHFPLTMYFQPSSHLWVGAGLSYDVLWNATGQTTAVQSRPGMSDSLIIRSWADLGPYSDTTGVPFKHSEWRGKVAVQYDWKSLTFGLSYDRAFTDFINAQNLPGVGSAKGRNQSLRLHLSWTFYERRKKLRHLPNSFSK
jgi:hypothetical protein